MLHKDYQWRTTLYDESASRHVTSSAENPISLKCSVGGRRYNAVVGPARHRALHIPSISIIPFPRHLYILSMRCDIYPI